MPHAKLHWQSYATQSEPIISTAVFYWCCRHPGYVIKPSEFIMFGERLRSIPKTVRVLFFLISRECHRASGEYHHIEKTELNLARWSKQRIKYTKFGPDISGEIITAHPASGHIFKRKWIGDSIAFYSSVSYYRQRKFTWGLRASSSSHNKWKD